MTTDTETIACPINPTEGHGLNHDFEQIRDGAGMIRVRLPFGEPAWLVTRYDDVRMVFADRRFSRAVAAVSDAPRQSPKNLDTGMLSMDPPEHTRLRTLVAKAFTMRRVERLRPWVAELADGFIDEMVAHGSPVDLVEHYALPIPVGVICELLGVPVADRTKFRLWSDNLMSSTRLSLEELNESQQALRDYVRDLIHQRRAEPADDLISALIEASDERGRLSEQELVDNVILILIAGHETTASQIPNFVYLLLDEPSRWAALRADPGFIPTAVEELSRFVPLNAGPSFARYATEDVKLGGTLVRAGEAVVVMRDVANRDPRRFDSPEEIRLDRSDNQHLGFGHGVHHCLGAQLARMELQEALKALLARLPGLHMAGEIVWKSQVIVRGPLVMPVGW